ncbi:MAG: arylsulfatase [Actinomycetota bacterium]|nr:arylsulfatase [Actinomycetota bacterium]
MSEDPTQAYAGFKGHVGRIHSTSTPAWPDRPTAPDGAPNILVMLCDDLGYADLGCYGSEIDTPHLDRLAGEGLRYTNFHVNPMCSPTRASLLTGLNPHLAGVATVCHSDPGYPGYSAAIRDDAVTMAEALRDGGWATLMVGKWHLCPDNSLSEAGPRTAWPCQRGFDRYYGFLDGFTNFHHPHRLYEDNHVVHVDSYPDDYYFTDDLTDRAVSMVREVRSGHPTKPWLLYFAHGAVHAPLQAKEADVAKYRGQYDVGWDQVRGERFARQLEMGVVPAEIVLPPRNTESGYEAPDWEGLTADQQETFARYQEVYAGMVDNIDQNFGRLRAELEAMGEWGNTVVVFTSDNGASREGRTDGTSAYLRTLIGETRHNPFESGELDHERLDLIGGPQSLAHYPQGWAMASGTPFRLYKINTHQGGHQVPMIVSRGSGLPDGGSFRCQYQHVTDVLPTILELVGVDLPVERNGRPVPELAGSSFARSLDNSATPSTHPEQYYEQWGHRGMYREGWSAVTCHQRRTPFSEDTWELYNLDVDPTETHDLASVEPTKLAELQEAWENAAWENQVFPLDEGANLVHLVRPPWEEDLEEVQTFYPGTPTVERYRASKLINFRSFEVQVELDYREGDQGILVAHGDQGGGYALYVEEGRLFHVHNGYGTMTEVDCGPMVDGTSEVALAVKAVGDLIWDTTVLVDGAVAAQTPGLAVLMAMAPFEGIDVGIDRRSPVSWSVYNRHGPFPYTGILHSVTYSPGELAPDAGPLWVDVLREAATKYE